MNKNHRDPQELDLTKPRLASYKQKWKRHQDTVYWVDIQLALKKGFKFYQTRSNAIILYDTLPAYCIPKAIMMGSGEIIYEKVYASPRPHPNQRQKIQLLEQGDSCQSNNPVRVFRKSKTFLTWLRKHPWKNRESCFQLCASVCGTFRSRQRRRRKRRRRLNKNGETRWKWTIHRFVHTARGNRHWLQSVWIDTSVVKQAENFRVRELVKKIESHPHRQALQADLQQNNACNPFSEESKVMIREMAM